MDWDDNYDNLIPMEYGQPMTYGIYSELDGNVLKVYNWDDLSSCVTFYKGSNEEGEFFSTDADEIITTGRFQCGIYPLTGFTWDDIDGLEATPFASDVITDTKKLNFGAWVIRDNAKWYERSFGEYAYLSFDFDITGGETGVQEMSAPVSVEKRFYNLQGLEIDEPSTGLYIKVENGKAIKILK